MPFLSIGHLLVFSTALSRAISRSGLAHVHGESDPRYPVSHQSRIGGRPRCGIIGMSSSAYWLYLSVNRSTYNDWSEFGTLTRTVHTVRSRNHSRENNTRNHHAGVRLRAAGDIANDSIRHKYKQEIVSMHSSDDYQQCPKAPFSIDQLPSRREPDSIIGTGL